MTITEIHKKLPAGVLALLDFTLVFWIITLIYVGALFLGDRVPPLERGTPFEK